MALRVVAALSAAVAILALWSVERTEVAHDLQLAAESQARPGETIALRALLFRGVDAAEGPTLAIAPARVRLRDATGVELATVPLTPSALDTLDGTLILPAVSGRFVLEATAELEGTTLRCRRELNVDEHAEAARLHGREAGPLQLLAIGRVHAQGPLPPPAPLLVRVVGGTCVPEQPCRLLTWVGEPAAALGTRLGPTVEQVAPPSPAGPTAGIVAIDVVVHGPDAQLTLEARRGGQLVAERSVRLPVGLGEVGLFTRASIVDPTALALRYALPPGREHAIADVFVEGRWRASRVVVRPADLAHQLDPAALPSGLARIQARVDRFTADGSGARLVYLRASDEDERTALVRIARQVARHDLGATEPTAAWASTLPAFAYDDVQRTAAFLLAALEQERMPVPAPASGRPLALGVLARTKLKLRFGVASALVLSALVIGLSIARRGLSASDEAQAILDEARGGTAPRGERFRERARVLLLVLAVASAFLAGALLIAAKPLWF